MMFIRRSAYSLFALLVFTGGYSVFFTLLFSCSNFKEREKEIYYVIKHISPLHIIEDDSGLINNPPPPSPPFFLYGNHNFILIGIDTILYYSNNSVANLAWCETDGVDETNIPKLNLTSEQVFEINQNELHRFLYKIIPDTINNPKEVTASISSPTDTIRSKAFEIIRNHFKEKGIKLYSIRNLTDEEISVLKRK